MGFVVLRGAGFADILFFVYKGLVDLGFPGIRFCRNQVFLVSGLAGIKVWLESGLAGIRFCRNLVYRNQVLQ